MIIKRFIFSMLFLMAVQYVHTQVVDTAQASDTTKLWRYGGKSSLSFSQIHLENWAAGGEGSVSGLGILHVTAQYKRDSTLLWDNELEINYGMQKTDEEGRRKTDDLFEISSKVGRRASGNWYYSGLLSFQTQLQEGFTEFSDTARPSSRFMAPAYIMASLGMDFNLKDQFTLLLSPITSKTTIVSDQRLADNGAYGVDTGSTVRYEVGGYLKSQYEVTIVKNVDALLKLNLFTNYLENPENIDVASEVQLSMNVNKFLDVIIRTNLKYDHDITFLGPDGREVNSLLQFKEVLGVTLTYKFL